MANCSQCGKDIGEAEKCPDCAADPREITARVNTAELVKQWEERAEKARGIRVVSVLGAKTDLGRIRENNEDKFEFFQPENEESLAKKGAFYAVADGMGGHAAGQIASEIALKTTVKAYYSDQSPMVEESLRAAIGQANGLIYETARAIPDRSGMGTTITALVVRGEEAFIAQVGDSRLLPGARRQDQADHRGPFVGRRAGAARRADPRAGRDVAVSKRNHPLSGHIAQRGRGHILRGTAGGGYLPALLGRPLGRGRRGRDAAGDARWIAQRGRAESRRSGPGKRRAR